MSHPPPTDAAASDSRLALSEESLRLATDAADLGTWDLDLTTNTLLWSNRTKAMFGISPDAPYSMSDFYNGLHSEDAERTRAAFASALDPSRRSTYDVEYRTVGKEDGIVRWVAARGKGVFDRDGVCQRAIGTVLDITERKQTMQRLVESEAALRALNRKLEDQVSTRTAERDRAWTNSQDLLVVVNAEGVFEAANPAWTHLLGWSLDEVVGSDHLKFSHPDDRTASHNAHQQAMSAPLHSYENRVRCKGGGHRFISWVASQEGERVYASGRDITIDRERERALRDSRAFTQLALSAVGGVGVWTFEMADNCFICDARIAELYGLDVAEGAAGLAPEAFLANVHPDDLPALQAKMARGLVQGGDLELEYRIRHPDGSVRWVLSKGHTYLDDLGAPVRRTGLGIETTRNRELEEQLRQSQKMEAVGQLTGGIAHDFNNLLTIIRSSVDFLRRGSISEERRTRYVEAISDTVERASTLTSQLLAFARRQPLKPVVFDLAAQVESVVELVRPLVGSRILIEYNRPTPRFVEADVSQLETALINLAVNGRDAMAGEGRLAIEIRDVDGVPPIRGHGGAIGAFLAVSVSDRGAGIPPDQLASIFEPFFTTKDVGKGTGLGLSQVFGFAKQSGGEVDVQSEMGRGSVFTLYLPRKDDPHKPIDDIPFGSPTEKPNHDLCILVVEDNDAVGQFATEMLGDLGHRSRWVGDAATALALLEADDLGFDVVFSDVVMPGMSGLAMAKLIRERHPGLPVILASGYSHVLAQEGPDGFELLRKPYSVDALSRVLRKAARRA